MNASSTWTEVAGAGGSVGLLTLVPPDSPEVLRSSMYVQAYGVKYVQTFVVLISTRGLR